MSRNDAKAAEQGQKVPAPAAEVDLDARRREAVQVGRVQEARRELHHGVAAGAAVDQDRVLAHRHAGDLAARRRLGEGRVRHVRRLHAHHRDRNRGRDGRGENQAERHKGAAGEALRQA